MLVQCPAAIENSTHIAVASDIKKILDMYPGIPYQVIGIGEGGIYVNPTAVCTVLGSCIAVTFYIPQEKTGATFHAILHKWNVYEKYPGTVNHYKYVDSAITHTVDALARRGIRREQIVAKIFGGAEALSQGVSSPGKLNTQTAHEMLSEYNITIANAHIGGKRGRKLIFITSTGEVYLRLQEELPLKSQGNT